MATKNKKGIILIACYLVITMLVILGSGLLTRSLSEHRIAEREKTSIQALWLAEAGVQFALSELNFGGGAWLGWNTSGDPYTITILSSDANGLSTGDMTISVADPTGNSPIIDATGFAPGMTGASVSSKAVRVELERGLSSIFTSALYAEGEIDITGSAVIDSYNSDDGAYGGWNLGTDGDVGSNGTSSKIINLTGSVIIRGDISTGPDGTIKKSGSIVVTGDETHDNNVTLPSVSVPSDLTGLSSSGSLDLSSSDTQTLIPGDYKFSEIDLSGSSELTLEGPIRIYITGENDSIKSTGSSSITTSGQVEIYIDGDAKVAGSGIVNQGGTPSDLYIYGTESCEDIDWSGSANFYGGIYAPSAEVDLSGSTVIFGAVVGNTIDVNGSAALHYDEALESSDPPLGGGQTFQILSWTEQ